MMADYSLATQIRPLDVATPLLQAARIRAAEFEQQQARVKTQQDAAGQWARGVAVYADKPEFGQKWAEGLDDLHSRGLMPTQAYQRLRDNPSPLVLSQILAQTTPASPLPAGFQRGTDGASLAPIPGGPADPKYITATNAAKEGAGTDDIKEYRFAKSQGFEGSFADWVQRKRAGAGEYSLTPQWGEDADGNPVIIQTGKSGVATRAKLPEGVSLRGKEPIKMDAGTHYVLLDPITRNQIGIVPKNVAGAAADKKVGEAAGEAQANLPTVEATADNALKTIGQLRSHPGKQYAIGFEGVVPPIAGTSQRDYIAILDQARGQTFLQAFQSLKGGGAITEVEGQKAEQALARLARTQTKEGYEAALSDLEEVIKRGVKVAREKAKKLPGQQQEPAQPANKPRLKFNPATGEFE